MAVKKLIRVKGIYNGKEFCAGLIIHDEKCVKNAPILYWCARKSYDEIKTDFRKRKFKWTVVNE